MDLSIIIVNWNGEKIISKCLESIKKNIKDINYEVIVVDNNSTDDSVENIKNKYPDVILVESDENLGFSKGNNLGAKLATGEFLLLLNPDTLILESGVTSSLEFAKGLNKDNILVGCKLLNEDRSIQISSSSFPTLKNVIFGRHAKNIEMHKITHKTDWVMGAFMIIKKCMYDKINGFDEDYFMYSEDMDICYKVKKYQGDVYYFADCEIVHLFNQSGIQKWNNNREKKVLNSKKLFYKKHYNKYKSMFFSVISSIRYDLKRIIS